MALNPNAFVDGVMNGFSLHIEPPRTFLKLHTMTMGTKMHFPCFTCTGLVIFENHVHINHLESVCEMKCLNLLCNAQNRH